MSGIILPGQDKQPGTENKIELPKGYSGSRKEEPVAESATKDAEPSEASPDAPAVATPAQDDTAQAIGGSGAEPGGMDLLFPPRGAQIQCPTCNNVYVVPVFSIVDLGVNPELKGPLLSGQINVASCPTCGTGGPLGAPLMVHIPEEDFLGVFVPAVGAPAVGGANEMERQKSIGELTQMLLRKIPSDERRGYMLQPQQFFDWNRLTEKLWEFEGVTPEMLRKQRDQSELLQQLARLADDKSALELAIERNRDLIDQDFFTMLEQVTMMTRSQPQTEGVQALMQLREKLLDSTEAGKAVRAQQERIREMLAGIGPQTTREELLALIVEEWKQEDGDRVVGTLAMATGVLGDYQFLMALAETIDAASDAEERGQLEELRAFLLEMQEQVAAQQQQSQESVGQQAQELLTQVMQSNDPGTFLRQHADQIDEAFLSLLAGSIQSAEGSKATTAIRRLQQVYEQAVAIFQEKLPAEIQFLNALLSAPDDGAMRKLLKENRAIVTKEFLDALTPLEQEMREGGRPEIADRIKRVRGQIALMI